MRYNYDKLRARIAEKIGTQKALAQALGTTEMTVHYKLNNESFFTQRDIEEWSAILKIPRNKILSYFFTQDTSLIAK